MDPGEESFTLSSFDFNSSFALYSSEDDDYDYADYEHQLNKRSKDDTDAYIELELPLAAMAATASPPPSVPFQGGASADDHDKELELRISFSAVVPFPGFFPSSNNSANIVSSKRSFSTLEDANAQLITAVDSSPQPAVESTLSCIHRGPISNHSRISIFPLAWTRLPPPVDDDCSDDCRRPVSDINGWELVRSRKASPAANGGITKLLVKLRSTVISGLGSMRASLAQAGIASSQAQKRGPNSWRLTSMKPFERWLTLCKPRERAAAVRTNGGSSSEMRSSSKVMEMKFEAMRKLFGSAVSPIKNSGSKSNTVNKSCRTSVKSSPVHQSGDASLVHAAIVHCKKSFGQNDDFSF